MQVFPMGMVNAANSTATLDITGNVYRFFEPNNGVRTSPIYTTLVTRFEQQTLLTRKKAEPFLTITYDYENIFDRELRQVEHFVDKMDGELTSFYTVDLQHGDTPTSITDGGTTWTINIGRTRLYSTISNQKANYAFVWDGNNFKIGQVSGLSAGTSITIDEDYGDLSATTANSKANVYPIYQVYFTANPMPNFRAGAFIDDTVATTADGGYLWSGSCAFVSKYKA